MTDHKQQFIDEVIQRSKRIAGTVADICLVNKADKNRSNPSVVEVKNRMDELEAFLQSRIGEPFGQYIDSDDVVVFYKTTNSVPLYRLDGK